jgi:hypothetical protein
MYKPSSEGRGTSVILRFSEGASGWFELKNNFPNSDVLLFGLIFAFPYDDKVIAPSESPSSWISLNSIG